MFEWQALSTKAEAEVRCDDAYTPPASAQVKTQTWGEETSCGKRHEKAHAVEVRVHTEMIVLGSELAVHFVYESFGLFAVGSLSSLKLR